MAKLREQRNLIKELHSYYKDKTSDKLNTEAQAAAFMGGVRETGVANHLYDKKIFVTDKKKLIPEATSSEGWDRRQKLGNLYQSCKDAGFIAPLIINLSSPLNEPKASDVRELGIRITDRGSDLLHHFGFLQIAWEKYSKVIVFLWGVLATVALKTITWIISNWQDIRPLS